MKIGIIGFGNMGSIFAESFCSYGYFKKEDIFVSDKDKNKISIAKRKDYRIETNTELAKKTDIILLAIKPDDIEKVIEEISGFLDRKKLLISIAAGVKIKRIEGKLKNKNPVIRVMPNLNIKVKAGIIVYCKGKNAKEKRYDVLFKKFFSPLGLVLQMPENKFDIITAISGSGPGFIFYIADVLTKICEKKKIERKNAISLVKTLFYGSGKLLFYSNQTPEELKEMVCSPKGTTIAGIEIFEKNKFPDIFQKVIEKSEKRSKELSKNSKK